MYIFGIKWEGFIMKFHFLVIYKISPKHNEMYQDIPKYVFVIWFILHINYIFYWHVKDCFTCFTCLDQYNNFQGYIFRKMWYFCMQVTHGIHCLPALHVFQILQLLINLEF